MTARILAKSEWHKLAETDAACLLPYLSDAAQIVAVEHAGVLVGCQVLQPVLHAEGLWIHPDYRKRVSVARRLWALVKETAHDHFGVPWFATGCASEDVQRLLEHVGAVKLPDHYMVPVGGSR